MASRQPKNRVANFSGLVLRNSRALARSRQEVSEVPAMVWLRTAACRLAMSRAAGSPLPETSPRQNASLLFFKGQEVEIIAADLLGRDALAGDIVAGKARRFLGQEVVLDLVGQAQLFLHAQQCLLLFGQAGILDDLARFAGDDGQQALVVGAESVFGVFC